MWEDFVTEGELFEHVDVSNMEVTPFKGQYFPAPNKVVLNNVLTPDLIY